MSEAASGPALVILAAGLGHRYGGAKQIAGIGLHGEWLLEYAIHDALAAGFAQVVLVIRAELREALQQRLAPHLHGNATLHFVEQTPDRVPVGCRTPAGRRKPLGTGHALWCCAPLLHGPFAVINADDYYGHDACALLARHFRKHAHPAMIGYRLDATLSPHGTVNRGVCEVDADGFLDDVIEYTRIGTQDGALRGRSPAGDDRILSSDAVVSLNCWGLLPDLLPDLETGLREFLSHAGDEDEYFLPHAIGHHLTHAGQRLAVLRSDGEWLGLTHPGDCAHVAARIAMLHAAGRYPTPLWPIA